MSLVNRILYLEELIAVSDFVCVLRPGSFKTYTGVSSAIRKYRSNSFQ